MASKKIQQQIHNAHKHDDRTGSQHQIARNRIAVDLPGQFSQKVHIVRLRRPVRPVNSGLNILLFNRIVKRIAFDGQISRIADQPLHIGGGHGRRLVLGSRHRVDFRAVVDRAVHIVGPERQRDLRRRLAEHRPVGFDMRKIIEVNTRQGRHPHIFDDTHFAYFGHGVVPAAMVAKKIKFNFGISSNYFLEIAKFRAARMLWANIVASYSPECLRDCDNKGKDNECRCAAKMKIHAETSSFNLTLFDAHVNLLRTQTEAMSAALAGVDSMTVTPFDKTYDAPNEFSERMARNQQLLLKEESHFDKVIDPAAGSYYIENLTVSIAKQAWDLFLAVEEDGGFYASVKAGKVQAAVNESNKARHAAVAKRKEVLLGTNQFPNFNEKAGDKKPVEATCCCGGGHTCEKDVPTLNFDRAASEFEALRLETEASGKRPKAFMLTIGNLAMRQARAQYSCNFLACAGYEVVDNLGFPTVEEGIEAAMAAKADIVVLCSSDDEYAEYAVPAFKALNGRAMFIVAGAPACMDDLKAAGIENFIHVRVNVLETLKEFNAKLLK